MKKIIILVIAVLTLSLVGCANNQLESNQNAQTDQNVEVDQNVGTDQEGEETTEPTDKKITVYISGPENMINKLEEEFEADRGDVADFLIMSCGQLRSKVWTEKEAGQIQADVVFGSDPLIYNMLDDEGLLDSIDIKNSEMIADEFKLENHNYFFVNERYVALIYNKKNLTGELPESYKDLAYNDENYSIVMADARQSSTGLGIAISLYQLNDNDIEYFYKLSAKDFMLTKSNGQVPSLIMEGQYDIGVAPYDSLIRLRKKAKNDGYEMPLEAIWPEEGAIIIRRPIGVIKNDERTDENQKTSEELVNFFISKKAQMITSKFGFASVRKDIENDFIPKDIKTCIIDWEKATKDEKQFKEQYSEIFK